MNYKYVMNANDLWEGEMRPIVIEDQKIFLVRYNDEVFAYEDRCAHKGVKLSDGKFENGIIQCKAHHWEYDASSGEGVNPKGIQLRCFCVRQKDNGIFIGVEPNHE